MKENIFIFAAYFRFTTKDDVKGYSIWGVALAEVEVDILTGEKQVRFFQILSNAQINLFC
jgi:xanthine dehydrogenase molybdopterin-binding subunit B